MVELCLNYTITIHYITSYLGLGDGNIKTVIQAFMSSLALAFNFGQGPLHIMTIIFHSN